MRCALATVAAAAALAGCGAPEQLSKEDGRVLVAAREHLDDAIDSEEALRTSKEEARRLRRRVQAIVSDGSFEAPQLDEFGLAKLGELKEVVPSLVIVDRRGAGRALDRPAVRTFLRFAQRDADRALLGPASKQVQLMVETVDVADAGRDTKIPTLQKTAEAYLREAEGDVEAIWPTLAGRLAAARDEL